MRRVLPAALLAILALSGCGSSSDDRSGAPTAPVSKSGSTIGAGITDARLGPATQEQRGTPLLELSLGGHVDPRAARPTPRQRQGVGAGAACESVDVIPGTDTIATLASATLCLINGERADRGLVKLTENPKLAQAALGHARDMVEKQYFAHEGTDGSTMTDRIDATGYLPGSDGWSLGENLAWGTGSLATARGIVNAWMGSEGHRENMLNGRYREIGLGIALGNPRRTDGMGATYATEFGVVEGSTTAAAPTTTTRASGTQVSGSASRAAVVKRARKRCKKLRGKKARACKARVARLARRSRG